MKLIIISIFLLGSFLFEGSNQDISIQNQNGNNQGGEIFKKHCASCHTGGLKGWITGAPEIGDLKDWKSAFDKELPDLINTVYTGTEDHKLKGGCDDCTKEQIIAAIKYIKLKTK